MSSAHPVQRTSLVDGRGPHGLVSYNEASLSTVLMFPGDSSFIPQRRLSSEFSLACQCFDKGQVAFSGRRALSILSQAAVAPN